MNALTLAALGTGFTFLMTAAGAAVVFLFKNEIKPSFQRVFLGFAAGVMIAASVWSLLIPSIEMAGEQGVPGWLPAAGGFALGALFLMVLDALMPHLHPGSSEAEGVHTSFKRTTLLVLAVTLHNIPEGMAVGLACALAAGGGSSSVTLAGAMALCLGMGLQNFPEGAAISLPLRREGLSRPKSFVYGALSGIVEPIGGILAVSMGPPSSAPPWGASWPTASPGSASCGGWTSSPPPPPNGRCACLYPNDTGIRLLPVWPGSTGRNCWTGPWGRCPEVSSSGCCWLWPWNRSPIF